MPEDEKGDASTTAPRISDEVVKERTGRDWQQWLDLLDARGGESMDHRQIVALVAGEGVSAWWQQSVTVTYEQLRGLRAPHQQGRTFQISRSKTIGVPLSVLFQAWDDEAARAEWLPEPVEVRKSTPGRSVRLGWLRDGTRLDVYLTAKGDDRSQVSVHHDKLANEEAAEEAKQYWSEKLAELKRHLEGKPE